MNVQLLASRKDIAGMNVSKFIDSNLQERLILIEEVSIFSDEEIEKLVKSKDSIIFLSRHSARSLRPSFTVHPIGNFGGAEYGGYSYTLVDCNSFLIKQLLLNINELINSGDYQFKYEYEISLEVTHHGPFSKVPVAFIEVGSSEAQWNDLEACRLIADAVNKIDFNGINNTPENDDWIPAIGFGGNHYATKFTRYEIESEYAFGHICAKYNIQWLNKELIEQMISKTIPTPNYALFDKKSMKRKQEIKKWLTELEIEIKQI